MFNISKILHGAHVVLCVFVQMLEQTVTFMFHTLLRDWFFVTGGECLLCTALKPYIK
jgi:hypothetical protein